jgi:hypothetical protein
MSDTKYKGKNIRVTDDAHAKAVEHCGQLINLGAWTSEAMMEKLERERQTEKVQYDNAGKRMGVYPKID